MFSSSEIADVKADLAGDRDLSGEEARLLKICHK
jgi:hypothetical protein